MKKNMIFQADFFVRPEIGGFVKIKKFLLDLGVGYNLQKSKCDVYFSNYDFNYDIDIEKKKIKEHSFNLKQFALKLGLGIEFGK